METATETTEMETETTDVERKITDIEWSYFLSFELS